MIEIKNYGYDSLKYNNENVENIARVTAVHKERYEIMCSHGQTYARLKSSIYYNNCIENYPTVGDFVEIQYNDSGDSLIISTLKRTSYFARMDPDPNRGEQAVAANFDYVFIMQSVNQDFNEKRLERYLTLAWQSGAIPVVVLTKIDLVDSIDEYISQVENIAFGVDVHAVSTVTMDGIIDLERYTKPGKTIVFLGSSGIGKSSLVNALMGDTIMKVNTIREDDSKGRHTTTHRQLIVLPNNAMVIDTPGMRELGLWNAEEGVSEVFDDIHELTLQCKFTNCLHDNEPGCAVRHALETGELSEERYERYLKLKKESMYAEKKAKFMQIKHQRNIEISKFLKQRKKK